MPDPAGVTLPKPPIVEAVLDIDCDLPPGRPVESLEAEARSRFSADYPKFRIQNFQEHEIRSQTGAAPSLAFKQGVQALRFLHDDERQLVQVRAQGYSFNRLASYPGFDTLFPEIERTWKSFVDLASPVQVQEIRLRYINRILVPIEDDQVHLEEWLSVGSRFPDENRLHFVRFVSQHVARDPGTGHEVTIALASRPRELDRLPVILDIVVAGRGPGDPRDWGWIESRILELRGVKNRIFLDTVTRKCLTLFQ